MTGGQGVFGFEGTQQQLNANEDYGQAIRDLFGQVACL